MRTRYTETLLKSSPLVTSRNCPIRGTNKGTLGRHSLAAWTFRKASLVRLAIKSLAWHAYSYLTAYLTCTEVNTLEMYARVFMYTRVYIYRGMDTRQEWYIFIRERAKSLHNFNIMAYTKLAHTSLSIKGISATSRLPMRGHLLPVSCTIRAISWACVP